MQRKNKRVALGVASILAGASLVSPPARAAQERYALSVFHFNVQYVAGGLVGFSALPDPVLDRTANEVEDQIVTESFEPTLDVFLAHPSWGADIEMQGYMLDVLAARHPVVLDKLRALAASGQVEVISFHYADQLFMAHAPEDWEKSVALNKATFAKHDVVLSSAVFCQEGQAGPGMAARMKAHGYDTLIFPRNLWSYQHGPGPRAPVYGLASSPSAPPDLRLVNTDGTSWIEGDLDLGTVFWFVDDGELFATNDFDPYFPEQFKKSPEGIAERVAGLEALEAQGFAITTVGKYVDAIEGRVPLAELPPLLDGTWQPNSTDGISKWLGGSGLWFKDERDNEVRTLLSQAHRELVLAETASVAAGLDAEAEAEIEGGFRLLALGEVSDGSGINPFRGEVEYSLAHAAEALRIARDVILRAKEALSADALHIDAGLGIASPDLPEAAEPAPADPLFEVVADTGDRASDVTWWRAAPGIHAVRIDIAGGEGRHLQVTFPGAQGDIVYTPGLADSPVSIPREAFSFEHFDLALQDGLIGLGAGRFLVKDQAFVHVAARVVSDGPDITFRDDTASADPIRWRFFVIEGDAASAARFAAKLNLQPEAIR